MTVQVVAWSPGAVSPIHNHGCWGLVAILQGRETNHFWLRSSTASAEIMPAGTLDLQAGDLLILHPDAIHHIEASGDEPTITFNLYGETNADQRFEFDLHSGTARAF
ncbi:MAG: hypothetical protein VKI63_04575 [Cyanobium sp.]|nr:hypothetical protein [Cyanobium sp.]